MTKKQSRKKRKRLFVDSEVQGSLVRQLVTHWALACALVFLYLFALEAFSNGLALSFSENLASMGEQFGILGLVVTVVSPVFIYDSIKLSNRFVGPMISFRRSLNRLASGDQVDELHFRQHDFWRELTTDFNRISAELKELRNQTNRGDIQSSVSVETEKVETH